MPNHSLCVAFVWLWGVLPAPAAEPSWEGKTVLLTRAGVKLEEPADEKIAPKTAGVAKDLTFRVVKEADGRLLIESRRQRGWVTRGDAVPFEQALNHFTEQLARNPKDSHALTARGVVLLAKSEPDKALADFNKAIELDPQATLAYYNRANLAYGKQQYDKALADYNTVIRNDPGFDWAYHVRGWIYYRRLDYDKALADYEQAIRLVPTETVFYRDRGNVALARKQYDKALADYSKAIELDPKYAVPWLQRGRTWAAQKDYGKALADYEKSVEVAPKDASAAYLYTNLALFRAGCPEAQFRDGTKALEAAERAYQLAKSPGAMAALAAAHAELSQFDKAVEWQTKAVAGAPAGEQEQARTRLKLYQEQKPYRLDGP
jgi:tetratricopeptide (TPR) repeat protein